MFNTLEGGDNQKMATLTRWDPFGEMQRLTDKMMHGWFGRGTLGDGGEFGFTPAVDIYEDDHNIYVNAELPGVKPDEVKISVENDVLTLSGQRKLEREDKREGYHRMECSYGSFTRSFALPEAADAENVDAELDSGVLKVKIAKRPEVAPKRIPVKAHAVEPTAKIK